MYTTLNAATRGIGTGPYMLDGSYVPNDHLNYVRNPNYWKKGQPYLDAINYKIITDEQARIAALRAGAIDGATVSVDSANALRGVSGLKVLSGLTAAFRELQFTIKEGENKPWADKRVRQAVNLAINRTEILQKVYNGTGQGSGHVAAGYGPWVIPPKELKTKWEKYDLPKAKKLMAAAGFSKGFDVTLTTFSTPLDFPAVAALIQNQLKKININVNIVAQDPDAFAAKNGQGAFEWDLTARGMRGDVDGYVAEFNPTGAFGKTVYNTWFNGYRNTQMWRLVGNGRITLDPAKRMPMYQKLNRVLMTELLEVAARLGLEVPGREREAAGHVRRVHRLQHRAAVDGLAVRRRNAPAGPCPARPRRRTSSDVPVRRPALPLDDRDPRRGLDRDLPRRCG